MVRMKDYLRTHEGLYFAVVSDVTEENRHLCTLRYALNQGRSVRKFETASATDLLSTYYPHYLYHSRNLDVQLHGVSDQDIDQVFKPNDTVKRLISETPDDRLAMQAKQVILELQQHGIDPQTLGITGSLMLGFHRPDSDIDFVVYGHQSFKRLRQVVKQLITEFPEMQLDSAMWCDAYDRRACELSFEEYQVHEKRKFNKLNWQGRKVDFTGIASFVESGPEQYPLEKLPTRTIQASVTDDSGAFVTPARYAVDHPQISEVVAYTATYIGQAFKGECIEATGPIERDKAGAERMVIGTSREATGESIRVPGLSEPQQ